MSSNWDLPTVSSSDTPNTAAAKLCEAAESLRTLHSGATAPASTVAYMLWMDTATGILKQRNAADSGWVNILSDVSASYGGLVAANAGAFTTLAPTSAVAATGSTALVRKAELDASIKTAVVKLGDITATSTFTLFVSSSAVTISSIQFVVSTTTTLGGGENWTIQVTNVTPSPDEDLISTAVDLNGDDPTAYTVVDLGADQNLSIGANEVLTISFTKLGTADDLTDTTVLVNYLVAV